VPIFIDRGAPIKTTAYMTSAGPIVRRGYHMATRKRPSGPHALARLRALAPVRAISYEFATLRKLRVFHDFLGARPPHLDDIIANLGRGSAPMIEHTIAVAGLVLGTFLILRIMLYSGP